MKIWLLLAIEPLGDLTWRAYRKHGEHDSVWVKTQVECHWPGGTISLAAVETVEAKRILLSDNLIRPRRLKFEAPLGMHVNPIVSLLCNDLFGRRRKLCSKDHPSGCHFRPSVRLR